MENTLASITLKDFQSLANVEVPLGVFTAIIGPSNTGKSALVRAIKALARNAAAPGLVREGKSKFLAQAKFSDGIVETLTKGKSVSEFDIDGKAWAKSGSTAVPDEVAQLWALPDFCITSQHDAPFLLAEPASTVAKTLGELTNAAMLMEAVREANKRRTEALTDEKARTREAEEAREEILTHKGLSIRLKAVEAAREALDSARWHEQRLRGLEQLIVAHNYSYGELDAALEGQTRSLDVAGSVSIAEGEVKKAAALEKLLSLRSATERQIEKATEEATAATIARSEAETAIHNLMSEAGYCPLCRQGVV
jgi:DNA repair ATPase RecN